MNGTLGLRRYLGIEDGIGSIIHHAIAVAGGDQFTIFMVTPSPRDPPYLESRLHVEDPAALKKALEAISGVLQVECFEYDSAPALMPPQHPAQGASELLSERGGSPDPG